MLSEVLSKYLEAYPDEKMRLGTLLGQVEAKENIQTRKNFTGHAVGTAVILSPDRRQVLLIYHPTFQEWQQPGGHWDEGEEGPWAAAEREAVEETGVSLARRISRGDERQPWLIESHVVPDSRQKAEPEHMHHAFWYVFEAESKELALEDDVIKQAKWVDINEVVKPQILIVLDRLKRLKA